MAHQTSASGFRVARPARRRYEFDDELVNDLGHLAVSDFEAAQRAAHIINTVRDARHFPETAVRAGDLHGAGLLREIAQLVVDAYREQEGPEVFAEALQVVADEVGAELVEGTMLRFVSEFPPGAVYRGDEPPEGYLPPHRLLSLEELMLVWLSNQNPAFDRFRELFHDEVLRRSTAYQPTIAALDRFFANRPGLGAGGASLLAMLQIPALASPTSILGQLEFIRANWAGLLGGRFAQVLDRLLRTLDVLREELKRGGLGAGPPPVPDAAALAGGRLGMEEYERFSADSSWMPRVVLLAKSTYVWLDQLARAYERDICRLDQVPDQELDRIAAAGFTGLWLIGVWERSEASRRIKQMRGDHDAVASAYALYDYAIAADLGGEDAYRNLRDRAGQRGIRLASDMVPNHVGIDGRWVIEHPHWFLAVESPPYPAYGFTGEDLSSDRRVTIQIEDRYWDGTDAAVVFKRYDHATGQTRFIYHGNDGTAMPWNDTAQLDYLQAEVREGVIQTILHVARLFPIIRFDAAMTLAKRHIQRLWFPEPGSGGAIPSRAQHGMSAAEFDRHLPQEFWREVVDRVATEVPDTLLLAEAFWLMEGYFVRTLGMHRVYNSAFMHMMAAEDNTSYRQLVSNVLEFDPEVLKRFVNFMSNPDEETAATQFGTGDKYFGVATLLATMPGLPMFGHGQVEGFTEKYGMEFRRAKRQEAPDEGLVDRHRREIFPLLHRRWQFAEVGEFLMYDVGNDNVFAYSNRVGGAASLVLYHNRYAEAAGRVDRSIRYRDKGAGTTRERRLAEGLGLRAAPGDCVILREQRSGLEYIRFSQEIAEGGLHFSLQAYGCQVFLDIREVHDESGDHARLCQRLNGRGVPSVDDAVAELRMESLYAALRDVIVASISSGDLEGACAALRNEGERRGSQVLAPDAAAIEAAVRNVSGIKNGSEELLGRLPEKRWRRAVAVAWLALNGVEAQQVRDWRLTVGLRGAFAAAGFQESADPMGRLVLLLIRHGDWREKKPESAKRRLPAPKAARQTLTSLAADPDALAFLQVNDYDGVRWFDRDAFRMLHSGLVTVALAGAKSGAERRRVARMSETLAEAEERSEYQLDQLLSA